MKQIVMSNHMRSTLAKRTRAVAVTTAATVVAAGMGVLTSVPEISVVSALAGLYVLKGQISKRAVWKSGMEGEQMLKEKLASLLGDEYTALFNVPTCHGDIDCVLVGPGGISAIEAKNHKGIIVCENGVWRHTKKTRKGTYTGGMGNPTAQVMNNIRYLRRYLRRYDMNHWINGLIVFTHPEVALYAERQAIAAVRLDELIKVLPAGERLSPDERISAHTHLIGLMAA